MRLSDAIRNADQYVKEREYMKQHMIVLNHDSGAGEKIPADTVYVLAEKDYDGKLPDFSGCPELRELVIQCPVSSAYPGTITAENLKKMSVVLTELAEGMQPAPDSVEELTIYVSRDSASKRKEISESEGGDRRVIPDFSGMKNLRKLTLRSCHTMDYTSLSSLHALSELTIEDSSLTGLHWLSDLPLLQNLTVHGSIRNVSGIEMQHRLRYVDLSGNRIISAAPLQDLPELQYLNLSGNPLMQTESLRDLKQKTDVFVLTAEDADLAAIQKPSEEYVERAVDTIRYRNKHRSEFDAYTQSNILSERKKPLERVVISYIQKYFQKEFYQINPWCKAFRGDYDVSYKERYVRDMMRRFPFLELTFHMKRQLLNESREYRHRVNQGPGAVCFLDGDLYLIQANASNGNGRLKGISGSSEELFRKKWHMILPDYDIAQWDLRFRVFQMYGNRVEETDLVLALLLAARSAITGEQMTEGTALMGKYSAAGHLCRTSPGRREMHAVRGMQMKRILYCGKKNFSDAEKREEESESVLTEGYETEKELLGLAFPE